MVSAGSRSAQATVASVKTVQQSGCAGAFWHHCSLVQPMQAVQAFGAAESDPAAAAGFANCSLVPELAVVACSADIVAAETADAADLFEEAVADLKVKVTFAEVPAADPEPIDSAPTRRHL